MANDTCTVCKKDGWPQCGHLDGMPDAPAAEQDADQAAIDEFDVGEYRGRGRPKLPPEMKRNEKLVLSLTSKELRDIMHAAADVPGGPQRLQDWARSVLLAATKKS